MKKIPMSIGLLMLISVDVFGCLCAGQIANGFNQFTSNVTHSINSQTQAIGNDNIPSIEKSVELLKKENDILKKFNKAQKEIVLKKEYFIFELNKKLQLAQ
ncbi:hypothetical protein [Campylobacter sp. US33a]|uniref:hypothetical protein n=1 Tax=Campylobacter sp. US33a TaxID=2498120 RepID=UPI0010679883|nr:hypothetical protein [Campylobacter sp. US33a]TEY00705.1 hypothetical protein ELQ16_08710 [Campylobacter sp. US33a]